MARLTRGPSSAMSHTRMLRFLTAGGQQPSADFRMPDSQAFVLGQALARSMCPQAGVSRETSRPSGTDDVDCRSAPTRARGAAS